MSVGGFLVVLFVFVLFAVFCVYAPHDLAKLARECEREEELDELWADEVDADCGATGSSARALVATTTAVGVDDFLGGAA